jgi:Tfp pilus assembly protein PilN
MSGIKNKQLDILKAYEDSLKDPHRYDLLKLIAAPLSILLVIAITCGALFFVTSNTQKQISDINTKIGTTKAAIEATDQQSYSELKTMQEAVSAMNEINRKISNYVSMSSTKLNKIVGFCDDNGIDITSLSFTQPTETSSTSTLTLQGSAEDPDDITMFVSDLRSSKLYKNINYGGYTQSQNTADATSNTDTASNTGNSNKSAAANVTTQTETVYTFTVTMVLK